MKRKFWTPEQVANLRELYPDMLTTIVAKTLRKPLYSVYNKAFSLGLKKSAAFLASDASGRLTKLSNAGASSRFRKGQKAWNAGLHYIPGGRCAEGWFRKGGVSKRWDQEAYAIGALRVNADGGLDIKTGRNTWEAMARYVWRTERGPIPRGGIVRPINGDAHDTRIENLRLGNRSDLMNENSYHRYPKDIARLIQLRGALNRQINKRAKHGEEHRRFA